MIRTQSDIFGANNVENYLLVMAAYVSTERLIQQLDYNYCTNARGTRMWVIEHTSKRQKVKKEYCYNMHLAITGKQLVLLFFLG